MSHTANFLNRVRLYTRTKTKVTVGHDETWSSYINLWASVLELDTRMTDAAGVVFMDQNQTTMKLVKITLRGRRAINVADTRFTWNGSIYKPLESARYAGRSDNQFSIVFCHEVTSM